MQRFAVPLHGEHQALNAALAPAVAHRGFGIALDAAAERCARRVGPPLALELAETADGVIVLNDAYNANPASMDAALRALAQLAVRAGAGSRCSATCASSAPTPTTRTQPSAGSPAELGIDVVDRRGRGRRRDRRRGARATAATCASWPTPPRRAAAVLGLVDPATRCS